MHVNTDITSRRYIAEEQLTFRSTPRVPDSELAETATHLTACLAKGG
jgi:histidine triad (HIT) family protein